MNDHVSDQQLSALIDGELSLASRQAVISHVRSCPMCAERHDRVVEVAAVLQSLPRVEWTELHSRRLLAEARDELSSPKRVARSRLDWTLPIAATLALLGVGAIAIFIPGLPVSALSGHAFDAIAVVSPSTGFLGTGNVLATLAAIVVLGLVALPLIRTL